MFIIVDTLSGCVRSDRETAEELEATIVTPEELVMVISHVEAGEVYGCELRDGDDDITNWVEDTFGIRG